ncbi:MAG: hypothetical protein IJ185_00935 [Prevotella sp.]|jgi:hypothetical protein|nr:hypothetical protein [Prevotella sp.]MBQ9260655.1 hypothetical protein [Prevotella sp.]
MNRKKALLLLSVIEAFLLAMFVVLFVNKAIGLTAFVACVITIGIISSALIVVAIRKLPPM